MAEEKVIVQQVDKKKIKGVSDIVFAIDVTDSMNPCIEGLKRNLNEFVDNLKTQMDGNQQPLDWRARILPFRDIEADKDEPWSALDNSFPFVTEEGKLAEQIESLEVHGGGDIPESVFDALYVAAKESDWREIGISNRFIILFTDAYPLEELHENTVEPGEDKSIERVIQILMGCKIKLYIVAPKHELFDKLSNLPKSYMDYVETATPTDGLNSVDFKKLLERVGETVSIESAIITA